jgi:signal transduction histidine kinase
MQYLFCITCLRYATLRFHSDHENEKPALNAVPVSIAGTCALIAIGCLIGWVADIPLLTSIVPGYPQMVPLTAVMALLASWTLAVRDRKAAPAVGLPSAWLLVALSVIVLASRGAVRPGWFAAAAALPLSSPLTATMFLAIGVSLLALPHPRHLCRAQWLALGVLLLALLTLAGYLLHDTLLYRWLPGTGTSLPTAAVATLLPIGILGARPSEGIMAAVAGNAIAAQQARRLLLSAIAMPVPIGALVWTALHFNLIDMDTGIALLVWGIAVLFVVATWQGALRLSHADAARRRAEAALEAALASLRAADVHKDQFLAMLAHELRNPLAPIRAAADLLRLPAGVDLPQQRRTGDIIARQVDHMSHLVEDLLDLARVRQGLISVERMPVDLCRVLQDALEQTKPLMARHRHQLHADACDGHPVVLGDHQRLVQVVANLLVNAARYTPAGGRIAVTLRPDAATHRTEIAVSDNGIGMDAALLRRVFDPFTQGAGNAGRPEGGLGIGLALVKSLVELHDGSVGVESAGPGLGSTFRITLPLPCDGDAMPAAGNPA